MFVDAEHGARQQAFRARLADSGVTTATVTSPSELETALLQALVELAREDAQRPGRAAGGPVWSVPPLRGDEVERAEVAKALVAAVLAPDAGAVGVTTGLVGAGGFGKTTLARMVCHDPRVRAEFSDGVAWVGVGEDASGPQLAGSIISVARLFDPQAPEVTGPLAAGATLERVLEGRRVLLVIDDVWSRAQVEPFLLGGEHVVRLFTTRQQGVLPEQVAAVRVDEMTDAQAHALLTAGLAELPAAPIAQALEVTGRWPVLLSLVHGTVNDAVRAGGNAEAELREVLAALRADGITALDVANPSQRSEAVTATIEVSLRRLTPDDRSRYEELAVFGALLH
jgi:hypothetical protein